MKKLLVLTLTLGLCASTLLAQHQSNADSIMLVVVNRIMENTHYTFTDKRTREVVPFENITNTDHIIITRLYGSYVTWEYWNGVVNMAFNRISDHKDDPKYKDHVAKYYQWAFEHAPFFEERYNIEEWWTYPFFRLYNMNELDDFGAVGSGLLDIINEYPDQRYLDYIKAGADHAMNKQIRLPNDTFARNFPHELSVWGDDLFMGIPFLARMGAFTGETKYFDEAVKQVELFHDLLFNHYNKIYHHGYYGDIKQLLPAHWGRANGWIAFAKVELLEYLPLNHPGRDSLIKILNEQLMGLIGYQSPSGMWRQLLDKKDSYLETSATSMFVYAFAKAINQGWIDKRYAPVAIRGWQGLAEQVQPDGRVANICLGTMMFPYLAYYYEREAKLNETHGLGAFMMAALEVSKMEE